MTQRIPEEEYDESMQAMAKAFPCTDFYRDESGVHQWISIKDHPQRTPIPKPPRRHE